MSRLEKSRMIVAAALVTLLVGTVVASAGCGGNTGTTATGGGTVKITDADNGKSFTVNVGGEVQVVVDGNPTTGYAWSASLSDKDAAILQQQGDPAYVQQNTNPSVVGSGGTYTFTFKALTAGQASLTLAYARSFEKGVAPIKTFTVTVTAK
jgi:inhibitor of cysteine peptidase